MNTVQPVNNSGDLVISSFDPHLSTVIQQGLPQGYRISILMSNNKKNGFSTTMTIHHHH